MKPYYADEWVTLYHGDCLDVLGTLADASVDSVVTDPPYGLEFMGKEWDAPWKSSGVGRGVRVATERAGEFTPTGEGHSTSAGPYLAARVDSVRGKPFQAWCELWARECLRVLKPGGHLLAFGGTRTSHRLACAIEDAGFEIRDSIAWLYGSGFPKSLDVSKAIDRAAGVEREVVGTAAGARNGNGQNVDYGAFASAADGQYALTAPATPDAARWQGWGTAMKPAHEPVVCARKPFSPVSYEWRMVATVHHALASLIWLSLSPAKRAELASTSSPVGRGEGVCASALVAAAMGTSVDESARTDTFNSPATASTCSNIASSWNAILGALSDPTRTSTTSTRSSTTTGLRILSSLLAQATSPTTMPACDCLTAGAPAPVTSAAASSSGEWLSWLHSLTTSAPANVGESTAPAVAAALASIAESLSSDLAAGSSAGSPATTSTATRTASGTSARTEGSSPAHEPVVVARKPLIGTVAQNILAHGTGALNVDGCRVGTGEGSRERADEASQETRYTERGGTNFAPLPGVRGGSPAGRWPANVCLDESQAAALDEQSGETVSKSGGASGTTFGEVLANGHGQPREDPRGGHDDIGGASRFFYTAKAGSDERPTYTKQGADGRVAGTPARSGRRCNICGNQTVPPGGKPWPACGHEDWATFETENRKPDTVSHPTVKPIALMRWLVRLVTPPGGTVLEPFAGSGTTAEACLLERFHCIAIEREADYLPLIVQRINRRRNPIAYLTDAGHDLGLFADEETA